MKNNIVFIFVLLIITTSLNAGDLSDIVATTQQTLSTQIQLFTPAIQAAALYILYSLAVIELVIVFGFMALRGELELGGILANLIRIMLIILIFRFFITDALSVTSWLRTIYNGFTALAENASGIDTLTLDSVFENVGLFWENIWERVDNNGYRGFGDSFILVVMAVIPTLFITLMVARGLSYYIFFLFSLYVGIFWFAFVSLSYTRQWAYNAFVTILRQGAKWMIMLLVIAISLNLINTAITAEINPSMLLELIVVSIILWGFSNGIDGWVDGYFIGNSSGENSSGVQMAQNIARAGAGGAVGGAMASVNQVSQAVAAGNQTSNLGGGNSSSGNNNSTSKVGNFLKSAGAGAVGAVAGATSGAVKGGLGMNTLGVGQKSGSMVGKTFSGKSANQNLSMNNSSITNKNHNLHADDKLDGTISKGKNDIHNNSNYVSGVPSENPND